MKISWKSNSALAAAVLACAAALSTAPAPDVEAQSAYEAEFTAGGALIRPEGWRRWVYIGTPLTPNALNDGEASFPEFHSVYIDPVSYEHYAKTGEFREGTLIAKELSLVLSEDANEDGSTDQVRGRGYFIGEFSGLEITYKSKAHFPDEPGNWAYFSFGHVPASTATAFPADACNACHEASAADDWVFTQFYPVRAAAP